MLGFIDKRSHGKRRLAFIEMEKRQGSSKTYTQPMPDEETYMIHFYKEVIFDKALEMKSILNKYPDTVGEHYNVLVLTSNTISFGCFWARYLHRCCIDTIINEMNNIEKVKVQQQQFQQSAIIKPILSKQLRDNIERGLGSRQPENVIESTGTGPVRNNGAGKAVQIRMPIPKQNFLSSSSSTESKCNEYENANLSEVELRTKSSTTLKKFPNTPEPKNDPYYMAIFELIGNTTEKLQYNNNNATISSRNYSKHNIENSTPKRSHGNSCAVPSSPRWANKLFTNNKQSTVQSSNEYIQDEFNHPDLCLITD
jgi:hypothetical protein